jgi:predicted O-methyltransferase YrrM
MHARALLVADRLVAAVGVSDARRMLDLGGGAGTFALAFARANPQLRAEVLDRPDVVPIAQRVIAEAGLSDRVTARAGDLRADAFGEGYDLLLASAVCHMFDEGGNQAFLRRCAQALVPGGRLVIRDFLLDPDRTGPREAALFALNMLVSTTRGNVYTEDQYRTWLTAAGFGVITRHRDGEDLLIAHKPQ